VKVPAADATINRVTAGKGRDEIVRDETVNDGRPAVLALGGLDVVLRRATLDEILAVRHAELRPGLPRASAEFAGDAKPTTRHFAAFATGPAPPSPGDGMELRPSAASLHDAIACTSFMVEAYDGRAAHQMRGMATRGDLVRLGIGSALLRYAIADLVARDAARLFWCNARVGAVPFYRRMGWQIASDAFDIPTVGPHRVMTFVSDADPSIARTQ
jgi:GNAT superfamily N-acetyltransferase